MNTFGSEPMCLACLKMWMGGGEGAGGMRGELWKHCECELERKRERKLEENTLEVGMI